MRWLVTAAVVVVAVDMGEGVGDVVAAEVIIPDNQTLFTGLDSNYLPGGYSGSNAAPVRNSRW